MVKEPEPGRDGPDRVWLDQPPQPPNDWEIVAIFHIHSDSGMGAFGGKGDDGIILRHSSNQWSGLHLHGIYEGPRLVSTVSNLAAPRSGWEAAWQRLTKAGLLTLPDAPAVGCSPQIFDGVSYVVEINKDQKYRTYLYDNPSHSKCSEAKQMLEIGGIIAEAFDLSEFKTVG